MNPRTLHIVRTALTAFILLVIVAGPASAQEKKWSISDFSGEIMPPCLRLPNRCANDS